MENILQILLPSIVTGLVAWGGIRTEMKYLRRDVDQVSARLNEFWQYRHPAQGCHP